VASETLARAKESLARLFDGPVPENPIPPDPLLAGPPAAPADVAAAFAELARGRDEAASRATPPGEGYGPRTADPLLQKYNEQQDYYISAAVRARAAVEDYQAAFRDRVAFEEPTAGQREDHPLLNSLSLMYGQVEQALTDLIPKTLIPISRKITELSKRHNISEGRVRELLNYAGTLKHLDIEGHAAFRSVMEADLARAEEELRKAQDRVASRRAAGRTPAAKDVMDVARAQTVIDLGRLELELYDEYQATGETIELTAEQARVLSTGDRTFREGDFYEPKTAGGINAVETKRRWAEIQAYFSESEMNEFADLTARAYEEIGLARLEGGVDIREDQANYFPFTSYVPLATRMSATTANGNHEEGYIRNSSRTDYARNGSTSANQAAGALDLLDRYVQNAALAIGQRDFVHQLNEFQARLEERGRPLWLLKVQLNDTETAPVGVRTRSEEEAAGSPGYIIREHVTLPDGRTERRVSKLVIQDLGDAELTLDMRKAFAQMQDRSKILSSMAGFNRWVGSWYVRYRAVFPIVNSIRDVGERLINMFGRGDFRRADGTLVEGPEVMREMTRILADGEFYSAYGAIQARGEEAGGRYGAYWKEFSRSGANYTWISLLKGLNKQAKLAAGVGPVNGIRAAVRKVTDSPTFQKVEAVVDRYNDFFNSIPLFAQYVAMRESGIAVNDAAAYVLDSMNFFKRGQIEPYGSAVYTFFRATAQGGANLLRLMNPFTKKTAAQQARGAVAGAALLTFSLMLVTLLRGMAAPDDPDEPNPYDELPIGSVTRYMNFPVPGGSFAKVPVPFGAAALMWTQANILDRYVRGRMDAGEAVLYTLLNSHKQIFPDAYPAYSPSDDVPAWMLQTISPTPVRPLVDFAVNKNFWGQPINYGSRAQGRRDFEQGRSNTPEFYHDAAKWAHDRFGADMTPETVRHFMESYAYGPLQGLIAYLESSPLYEKRYESTRAALGPMLSALGAVTVWGAQPNTAQSAYYNARERYEREFRNFGIRLTDPDDTKPEAREATVRKTLTEWGYSREQIEEVLTLREAEKELRKLDTGARESFVGIRTGQLDAEKTRALLTKAHDAKQKIYDRVARSLRHEGRGRYAPAPED
jgi:hypothetical protein